MRSIRSLVVHSKQPLMLLFLTEFCTQNSNIIIMLNYIHVVLTASVCLAALDIAIGSMHLIL